MDKRKQIEICYRTHAYSRAFAAPVGFERFKYPNQIRQARKYEDMTCRERADLRRSRRAGKHQ
jgi:hypothetical protein